jgi:predicted porin
MQKKIIALAVASALVAPAAFADTSNVTVYGVANVSYDLVTTKNAAGNGVTTNKVSSNTSRIGLKGSEDLGDGLSAIWQVESLINIDNAGSPTNAGSAPTAANGGVVFAPAPALAGTLGQANLPGAPGNPGNTIGNRNTFAGLSSATLGTVIMGRHDTPYNISTRKMDVFTDGLADNRSLMGGNGGTAAVAFDGRQPDVLAYISPSMGGFTGAIAYLNLTENNNGMPVTVVPAAVPATQSASKVSAWSMAGMYSMDAFYASLAYEVHDIGAGALLNAISVLPAGTASAINGKESAWKLGLAYTQDAINVNFAYEKTSDNLNAGANALGHSAYYLSGKYSFGNDAVKAAYTKVGNLGVAATSGATQFSLGYDHSLSKRTTVYAVYTAVKSDASANYGLSNIGTGGANTAIGLGSNPSALSFGMKHTF